MKEGLLGVKGWRSPPASCRLARDGQARWSTTESIGNFSVSPRVGGRKFREQARLRFALLYRHRHARRLNRRNHESQNPNNLFTSFDVQGPNLPTTMHKSTLQEDCIMLPSSSKTTNCMMECDCAQSRTSNTRATVLLGYCEERSHFRGANRCTVSVT